MSEIKPVIAEKIDPMYFVKQSEDMFILIDESNYNELSESCYTEKLYPAAALEALQAENADLRYLNLSSMTDLQIKNRDLEAENAAQAKRIAEQLAVIEATANFARDFWHQADKDSETRIMVPTFKELERKLRTYSPAQNGTE